MRALSISLVALALALSAVPASANKGARATVRAPAKTSASKPRRPRGLRNRLARKAPAARRWRQVERHLEKRVAEVAGKLGPKQRIKLGERKTHNPKKEQAIHHQLFLTKQGLILETETATFIAHIEASFSPFVFKTTTRKVAFKGPSVPGLRVRLSARDWDHLSVASIDRAIAGHESGR